MKHRKYRYFSADFETTVYKGQTNTEVWASACVELNTEDVQIFHSIGEQFDYFLSLDSDLIVYYHNLKFDGNFWLSYLLVDLQLEQAFVFTNDLQTDGYFVDQKDMKNKTFSYAISDMGQWYFIRIKYNNHFIELRDSLKLLPFSVKQIGDSFKTKHRKLDMEYTGFRYAGCVITEEEKEYIKNDVLVVKEALEIMFQDGHNKLTIGACCLAEYKKTLDFAEDWEQFYPNLTQYDLDKSTYGAENADEYIRRSYKGGWCYVVKNKENKIKSKGVTADVNSLYPSMMHSESGNRYPTGKPYFWSGNYIPEEALKDNRYFFVRVKTRFYIKKNYLPFIQIKGNYNYQGNECLESSDYYDKKTNKYYDHYYNMLGELMDTKVTLTLTMTDYYLIKKHYKLVDFEILDGCWFYSAIGIFDKYIDKYKKIKQESKGALRTEAKLFLNNLYGKMASNDKSSFKYARIKEDKTIGFWTIVAHDKTPGYIAIGSAITSYARNFTITAAQLNYYGSDKPGFIYADTDSIHCDLDYTQLKGIKVHESDFCCWKLEALWDTAIFARQKTYIEHVTHEDLQSIDTPYYNVKCAGMPQKCKDLFVKSFEEITEEELKKYTEEEQEFLQTTRTLEDFKVGLKVPGKLMPKRIRGGILLVETTYEMR